MATTRRAGAGPSAPAVYTGPVTHWEKQVIEWGTTGIVTTRWVDMKINNKMAYPGRNRFPHIVPVGAPLPSNLFGEKAGGPVAPGPTGYWEGDRADEVAGLIPRAPPQASGRGENIENGDAEAADAGDTLDEQNGSGEGAVEREEMVVDD